VANWICSNRCKKNKDGKEAFDSDDETFIRKKVLKIKKFARGRDLLNENEYEKIKGCAPCFADRAFASSQLPTITFHGGKDLTHYP
jgi:hypothetical protein